MDRNIIGNENDSDDNGKIRITLGFVIQMISTLVAITLAYASLRSDLNSNLKEMQMVQAWLIDGQKDITNLKIQQGTTLQMLNDFRVSYEKDMNRYIREPSRESK